MTPKSLLAALKPAANTASKKSTLPVLECFRFRDGKVLTNDTTMQTTYPVEGVDDLDCCINVSRFTKALSAMPPDAELKISTEKQRIVLRAGRSRHTVPTLPAQDMPTLETPQSLDGFITIPNMSEAISRVLPFSAPAGDVRYYMLGPHIRSNKGRLIMEATDGHRCAKLDAGPCETEVDAIIPGGAAASMQWITDPKVKLDEKKILHASSGQILFSTKIIDGTFPPIDRVIPTNYKDPLVFDKAALSAVINGALAARSADKQKWIRIEFSGHDAVFLGTSDTRDIESEDGCQFEGRHVAPPMAIGMNAEYIKAALASIKGEKVAWYPDPVGPSVFSDPDDDAWVSVIMPTKI